MTDPYSDGREAYWNGQIIANCPYRHESGDRWREGFRSAEAEAEAEETEQEEREAARGVWLNDDLSA